jgi:hypothetical protein
MSVVIATSPDDVLTDGYRILLVDLDQHQSKTVSDVLLDISYTGSIIIYNWKTGDDTSWLIDKKHKSNLILFNADSSNEQIVGYIAAQKNSHYFGYLKNLAGANTKAIYASEDLKDLLTLIFNQI